MHQQRHKLHLSPANECDTEQIESDLKDRLAQCLASKTNGAISKDTGFNPETIRRYRITGRMPASFLIAVSQVYCIDICWLVSGEGLQKTPIKASNVPQILREIADHISNRNPESALNTSSSAFSYSDRRVQAASDS